MSKYDINYNDDMSEEFNNFMYRVTEVNDIVHKLSSTSTSLQNIGLQEADRLLGERKSKEFEDMTVDDIKVKIKSNKTLINRKALIDEPNPNSETMTQEAFIKEVSRDADKRYKDKCVRKEKMETFKKQATKAFRREEFEKALSCYNKAIELIRDSPLLYNNRCITYINLKLYKPAIEDAKTALKLNENCLRSLLLLAKAYLLNGDEKEYENALIEAKKVSPVDLNFINDFQAKLKMSTTDDSPDASEEGFNLSGGASASVNIVKTIEVDATFEDAISAEGSSD